MKQHSTNACIIIAGLIAGFYTTGVVSATPMIVHAVVSEVKDHPEYPPEGRSEDSLRPPVWEATLVIDKVLSGPEELLGQKMYAMTNNKSFGLRTRSVMPKLKVGEAGIWGTVRTANAGLINIMFPPNGPETEFGLPLIKGRDGDYEKVLAQLSAGAPNALPWYAPSNYPDQIPPENTGSTPATTPEQPQAAFPDPQSATMMPSGETSPLWKWPMVAAVVAAAFGLPWVLLKKRK